MAVSSPRNTSLSPSIAAPAALSRAVSQVYSDELKQKIINRALRSVVRAPKDDRSVTIKIGMDDPLMVNPPYGYLPFAVAAQKGQVSPERLQEVITYCAKKKWEYSRSGDTFRSWVYANRESMLAGIASHLTSFSIT